MRNLSGASLSNPCWPRQPAAACAAAGSCGSSGAFCFIPVVPGVLLCWRAPSPPRIRYKILPARCCANQSGTKLSLHAENAPNRAISGEQGEFCTAHAVRRGVRGEFCTEGARCGCSWASCVVLLRSPCASWRAMAVPRRHPRALRPGPPDPPAPSAPGQVLWSGVIVLCPSGWVMR